MQKAWIEEHQLGWNPRKAQSSAQEMFRRIFHMKFLPPGRGLWAMGSDLTSSKGLYAALNNCAFVSTETIKDDHSKPFCFLMDLAMLGFVLFFVSFFSFLFLFSFVSLFVSFFYFLSDRKKI